METVAFSGWELLTATRFMGNSPAQWLALPEPYVDGGFTGGNTDRPALQRLLADIEAGKGDVVLVYRLDRLSRSTSCTQAICSIGSKPASASRASSATEGVG